MNWIENEKQVEEKRSKASHKINNMLPDLDEEEKMMYSTDSISIDTEEPLENLKHRKYQLTGESNRDKLFIHS